MTSLVAHRSLRLLLASWRGQLEVLAGAGLLLGFTLMGVTDPDGRTLQMLLASLELLFLLAWSIRAAACANETFAGMDVVDDLQDAARAMPWLLSGVAIAASPVLLVGLLWWGAATVHPLLGLLLVLPGFAVALLVGAPVLLAACGAALGGRSWIPRSALRAVLASPLRLAGVTLVAGVAAGIVAIPVVLVAMVVGANTPGPVAAFLSGVAAAGGLPVLACAALATWSELELEVEGAGVGASAMRGPGPAPGAPVMATGDGVVHALAWIDGPTWDAAIEPGAAWGTWVRVPAAANIGLRMGWNGDAAPVVTFGRADGTWQLPAAQPARSGDVVYARVEAGDTYVQLVSHASHAQAITMALVATGAVAAAS